MPGRLGRRREDQCECDREDNAAEYEEPGPAGAQRDHGGEHLAENAGNQERGRHRSDRPGSSGGCDRFCEIGQCHGGESGGGQALQGAQQCHGGRGGCQRAQEGGDGEHADGDRHDPLSAVSV